MTAEVLDEAGIDWAAELADPEQTVTAEPGPLKTSRSRGGAAVPRGRRRPAARKLEALQKQLSSQMFQAGAIMGLGVPVTGYYVCQESDAFTKAVVQLAAHRPEWVEALEHIVDIQPGIVVGRTVVGIGAAFAVDRGRIDPERRALQFLGVTAAWNAVQEMREPGIEEGNAYTPPPATFVPVA